MRETIFYTDELNDEFSTAEIKTKKIDANYAYERPKFLWCVGHFFWYNIVAKPLAKLFLRCKFHHKIVNRDCIKEHEKTAISFTGIIRMQSLMLLFRQWCQERRMHM